MAVTAIASFLPTAATLRFHNTTSCRYLPGDLGWPSEDEWSSLNRTVDGRLIVGTPVAQSSCYGAATNSLECAVMQSTWPDLDPVLVNPVNVMSPYWVNNSCSPFLTGDGSCSLGNQASYAINVSCVSDVTAGIKFARKKNIRLSIKNTGHDYLGRSAGKGSLALWTHNLKDMTFMNYSSANYTGPAAKVGAGVQVSEFYKAASEHGYQVVGGSCPTVGVAGGWVPGGGHGPLTGAYGLGADNALEFEVVTTEGKHLIASPTQNFDLYWALSGGGPGNYAIVISITMKAHIDVPVVGAKFDFENTDDDNFYAAITAYMKHLLVLDNFVGFKAVGTFTNDLFRMDFATWPGATVQDMNAAWAPFLSELKTLNISLTSNDTRLFPTFYEHYGYFGTDVYTRNATAGSHFIPRWQVEDTESSLPELVDTMKSIAKNYSAVLNVINSNVTHLRVGNTPESNSVYPGWRDSLANLVIVIPVLDDAPWSELKTHQAVMNDWEDQLRDLAPDAGGYINEGTYDNVLWKEDYFGVNYDRLRAVKKKYDPSFTLYTATAVGSDAFTFELGEGRLCTA
ncbi:putative fad fmn-containing isoamyl alcohol oxidase protein [Botrytis fragariae]|uniref:Putative fad fmn-containing isoamyl alcohol oxidase protein n=1 Tax=Botrytis fragariae TaxID=1964551 RepID=A0A8H6AYQ2_9HELO|nr:putative fad fmn-containing isoamyl alcohol oxidase protein [Botrytis fragariae]KAF5875947.1 putative fad fmn-containing isoamyl alcohol oxidase protein [Botrytis fragariae]